jgi:hypothetical protein
MKEKVKIEWAKQFLWSLGAKQIKKWRDVAMHLISWSESKIPEAAAAETLEDYIMLWMDRRHICENNMKKERKGTSRHRGARRQKGLFILNLPRFRATSNKPHPNSTNAMQYREWIDESCLPYQQIA